MTIVNAILDNAGGPGSLTFLDGRMGARTVAWTDVHDRARRMAAILRHAGVGPGRRVGLVGDPDTDLVTALQAVWLAGAAITVLPIPDRPGWKQRLAPMLDDARLDLVLVGVGALAVTPPGGRSMTIAALRRRSATARLHAVHRPGPDDLAVLQYTSGSTRTPRGVPVTHGHLAANLAALDAVFPADLLRSAPMASWLPLYHDLGLIGFLAFPMSRGFSLVLQAPDAFARHPAGWLTTLSRYGAVATGAPDFAYRLVTPLLEAGPRASPDAGPDLDLRAVRFVLTGGEPVTVPAMQRFLTAAARYGLDPGAVVAAYGLAESTLAVTCSRPGMGLVADTVDPDVLERDGRAVPVSDRAGRTLARLGRPVRGTRVRVVDPATGMPVGDRVVGEVEVQGASVVNHYWGEPRPPADAWLRTGDLGYLADDDLLVCGRRKDVLFAAGRNLYPHDIEVAAGEVPGVRVGGAVAFGIPGDEGDLLVVVVESRTPDPGSLHRAVAAAVTAEAGLRPARVVVVRPGRLPRTTSGKLRRAETRRRYVGGDLDAPSPLVERTVR